MFQCGSYVPDFFWKKDCFRGTFLERVDIFFQKNGWVLGLGGGNRVAVGSTQFSWKKKRETDFFAKKNVSV